MAFKIVLFWAALLVASLEARRGKISMLNA
jgi:hypothetical protein